MKILKLALFSVIVTFQAQAADKLGIWMKFEENFTNSKSYENVLYDVKEFVVTFTSPTGRQKNINGFWDGDKNWKVRFAPDEKGLGPMYPDVQMSRIRVCTTSKVPLNV